MNNTRITLLEIGLELCVIGRQVVPGPTNYDDFDLACHKPQVTNTC